MKSTALRRRGLTRFCVFLFLTAAVSAAILIWMQSVTTYTADDYYYAQFWSNGPVEFFMRNLIHFSSRNGRVLVHLLAETLLALGMPVYAVSATAILCGILALFLLHQRGRALPPVYWAVSAAAFFTGVLLVDYRVMKSWMLCVSDACNYIFPLFVIGLMLFCLDRASERDDPRRAAVFLCAFLAGATTEQGGAMAVTLLFFRFLGQRLREKRADRLTLQAAFFAFLGLLTIFLSPATILRAGAEFSFSGAALGFVQYASSIAAPGMSLNIMAVFCVLTGLLPITGKAPRLLFAGFPLGLLLAAGHLVPPSLLWNTAAAALFFCYLLTAALVLLFRSPYGRSGAMLLAGMCSAALVMLTCSVSVRVTTPLLLIMLLCGVFFLAELCAPVLEDGRLLPPAALCAAAMLILAVLLKLPALSGLRTNHDILLKNEQAVEAARVSNVLVYTDYEPYYCLTPIFSQPVTSANFLSYYGLEEVTVVSTYTEISSLWLNGAEETVIGHDGRQYVPIRAVTEDRGGELLWVTDDYIWLRLNGESILHMPFLYTDRGVFDVTRDVISYNDRTYISIDMLKAAFQIDLTAGLLPSDADSGPAA